MLGHFWLLFLMTLALTSLIGSLSTDDIQANLGGVQGFVFFTGLAVCSVVGWWPWIMVVLGISAVLGTLQGAFAAAYTDTSQTQKVHEESQHPYQEGYQQAEQAEYREGENMYQYPPQVSMDYESPQSQYPQEIPGQR
jgi:hypothetical protein